MLKSFHIFLCIFCVSLVLSCKKEEPVNSTANGNLYISINYKVNTEALIFDSRTYTNAAGNNYEVNMLNYYISNMIFYSKVSGDFKYDKVFYCDARRPETNKLVIQNLPKTVYDSVTFHIGLDTALNHSYQLANTNDNINMVWPDAMGGGYHFLKLEGNYNYNGANSGYAMHLGRDTSLVNCAIHQSFIFGRAPFEVTFTMDINEWFKNPHTFDFNTEGNYIMGNNVAMRKIADNGKDVFTLDQ